VWNLIGRALRIDALPVLVTRKIVYPSYYVFREIGLLAFQVHFQFFPPKLETRVGEIRHKDGLGFSDIRCSDEAPPALVRYFAEHLPRLAPGALERFLSRKDILSRYAMEHHLEDAIPGNIRSARFHEFEEELFPRETEEPEVDYGWREFGDF